VRGRRRTGGEEGREVRRCGNNREGLGNSKGLGSEKEAYMRSVFF